MQDEGRLVFTAQITVAHICGAGTSRGTPVCAHTSAIQLVIVT